MKSSFWLVFEVKKQLYGLFHSEAEIGNFCEITGQIPIFFTTQADRLLWFPVNVLAWSGEKSQGF